MCIPFFMRMCTLICAVSHALLYMCCVLTRTEWTRFAVTGSALKALKEQDLEAMGIQPSSRTALLRLIQQL